MKSSSIAKVSWQISPRELVRWMDLHCWKMFLATRSNKLKVKPIRLAKEVNEFAKITISMLHQL